MMSKNSELIKFERERRCDLKDGLTGQRMLLMPSTPDHHNDDNDDDDSDCDDGDDDDDDDGLE